MHLPSLAFFIDTEQLTGVCLPLHITIYTQILLSPWCLCCQISIEITSNTSVQMMELVTNILVGYVHESKCHNSLTWYGVLCRNMSVIIWIQFEAIIIILIWNIRINITFYLLWGFFSVVNFLLHWNFTSDKGLLVFILCLKEILN